MTADHEAAIRETFVYVAPIHESVVRDASAALDSLESELAAARFTVDTALNDVEIARGRERLLRKALEEVARDKAPGAHRCEVIQSVARAALAAIGEQA